ncbi:MAG: hypothetical protein AAGA84_09460, partial [Pseudomonadota bacterium]
EFVANWRGKDYRVQPEYNYELTGMVVSLRQHDGNSRMHSRSQDHLNVADLCVIWGDTAVAPTLSQVSFWNGIFTCNYKTSSHEAWRAFNESEISNNHLISDDPILRDLIRDVRVGDQIRLRGQLASYVSPSGSKRGTSVTRDDRGNGACETIYVRDFFIENRPSNPWRLGFWVSLALLVLFCATYLMSPHKVRGRQI